jgi:hypothetical protein
VITLVRVMPSGSAILACTSSAHGFPVTFWMISPSTM